MIHTQGLHCMYAKASLTLCVGTIQLILIQPLFGQANGIQIHQIPFSKKTRLSSQRVWATKCWRLGEHLEDVSLHNGPTLVFPPCLLWVIGFPESTGKSLPKIPKEGRETPKGRGKGSKLRKKHKWTHKRWVLKGWGKGLKNQKCKIARGGA